MESGFVDDNGLASTSISSCFYRAGGTGGRGAFSPTELSMSDPAHQVTISHPGGGGQIIPTTLLLAPHTEFPDLPPVLFSMPPTIAWSYLGHGVHDVTVENLIII